MQKPTFLILGGMKCGTTSLQYYMGQHPDVFISTRKEPIFFEAEYERGLEYYWETYFQDRDGEKAVGEARVFNLYLPYVVPYIREALPDARLIAALRNPVDRAYSHWWHRFSRGRERLTFSDAIGENLKQLERGQGFDGPEGERAWRRELNRERGGSRYRTYVDQGYFAIQLRRYLDVFPRSQVETVFLEDLVRDPIAVVRNLWKFVGVSPEVDLLDRGAQNVSRDVVRGSTTARMLDIYGATPLPRLVPEWLKARIRVRTGQPAKQPPMSSSDRRRLADHYREHNRDLEALLGRDLSSWSDPAS